MSTYSYGYRYPTYSPAYGGKFPTRLALPPTPPVSLRLLMSTKAAPSPAKLERGLEWNHLPMAGGLFFTAMLLNVLEPMNRPGRNFLPTDWKPYAKIALGASAVRELNNVLGWKPPSWLLGMETVAVLHPIMLRFSKNYPLEVGIMASLIAGVVYLANQVNKLIAQPMEDIAKIPKPITQLLISVGFTLASMAVVPKIINRFAVSGILGKVAQETVGQGRNVMLGSVVPGANCGCGNVICISQVGEILAGMANWVKSHSNGSDTK
jgi:hypothetical protein